jgi:hypothetical protein
METLTLVESIYTAYGSEYKSRGLLRLGSMRDKGRISMKRVLFVVAATVALVSVPGTASAQDSPGGCREFGQGHVAVLADVLHPFGQDLRGLVPINDEVVAGQSVCG